MNGLLLTKGGENVSNQIDLINSNHRELPILNSLRKTNEAVDKRNSDIIYVFGSSGSGKTFFAVKDIVGEKTIDNKLKSMTFYLHATGIYVPEAKPSGIPENVMQIVKESIKKHLKHHKIVDKLNMRLSLVIDEAGSPVFDGYFEIFDNLECIHSEMRKIATNCRLIIAGTGLTAQNVSSQSQAKKYRMMQWQHDDVQKIIESYFDANDIKKLTESIYNQPTIKALTTNARSALFVIDAMKPLFGTKGSEINEYVLRENASYIVHIVVSSYIQANGINDLTPSKRRLVSCMVFEALNISSNSPTEPYIPKFEGLESDEKIVALSMIDTNVEIVNRIMKLADPDLASVIVSPALAIILFSMFGISADIVST